MNTTNYSSLSEETKREAILFSLRGRMISYIGSLLLAGLSLFPMFWFMIHITNAFFPDSYTARDITKFSVIGFLMFVIFFGLETLNFFLIRKKHEHHIINPLWFISQPTYQEIDRYLKHQKEVLVTTIESVQNKVTLLHQKEEELDNEIKSL